MPKTILLNAQRAFLQRFLFYGVSPYFYHSILFNLSCSGCVYLALLTWSAPYGSISVKCMSAYRSYTSNDASNRREYNDDSINEITPTACVGLSHMTVKSA